MIMFFKSCPRCIEGDLVKNDDHFGAYLKCVQCGFMKDVTLILAPEPVTTAATAAPAVIELERPAA